MARGRIGPEWTSEVPKVTGYYWMRHPRSPYTNGEPVEVSTDGEEGGSFVCYSIGTEVESFRYEIPTGAEWFGPIVPPL